MSCYLLLGAGFTRNWGGWLASEVFEYLLGAPEVQRDTPLRALLWHHTNGRGFEGALQELQRQSVNDPASTTSLETLTKAIVEMFNVMNTSLALAQFEFSQDRKKSIGAFLSRFDAIFSLNQDLLLEQHYLSRPALEDPRRWTGAAFPGMAARPDPHRSPYDTQNAARWVETDRTLHQHVQPIFKLHGSSNWFRSDDARRLIMGGTKSGAIANDDLLAWYWRTFEEHLRRADSRLMVIGYGFGDNHVNDAIERAARGHGLRLFIVSPEGPMIARSLNRTRQPPAVIQAASELEDWLEPALIGASRRPLRSTFSDDDLEWRKLMRFFPN